MEYMKSILCIVLVCVTFAAHATTASHFSTAGNVTSPNASFPTPQSGTNPPPSTTSKLTSNATRPPSNNVTNAGVTTTSPPPSSSDGSVVRDALRRIISKQPNIRYTLDSFNNYQYSPFNLYEMLDGGNDMYDNGNRINFSAGVTVQRVEYHADYSEPGSYEFASISGWPFVALMYINNTDNVTSSYSIRVSSNTGADGNGSLVYFQNNTVDSTRNISLAYYVTQVYGAGDSSICEVYFAMSEGSSFFADFHAIRESNDTDEIDSAARLENYPKKVWLGYTLFSRLNGEYIHQYEVENALAILVSAIFDYDGNETLPPPDNTTNTGNDSEVYSIFSKINEKRSAMTGNITNFHYYQYDGGLKSIVNGGGDMYKDGNRVYFQLDEGTYNEISYGKYYSVPNAYEIMSSRGHPFIALMNMKNVNASTFTLGISGFMGANGRGLLTHFETSAQYVESGNASYYFTYYVTQVHGAGVPSICEVYFTISDSEPSLSNKKISLETYFLDSSVRWFSPTDGLMGVMLLSKENGAYISPTEVNKVMNILAKVFTSTDLVFSAVRLRQYRFSPESTTNNPFENIYPTTTPSNNVSFSNASRLRGALERIKTIQSNITNSLYNFHYYDYSTYIPNQIADGGNDMYDGGNQVQFVYGGGVSVMIEYGAYYSEADNYELSSLTGWPFVTLMYVSNAVAGYNHYEYILWVQGDTGADEYGNLVYFGNSAFDTARNISVAYYVTQIYNAYDPTICEVYFALSEGNKTDAESFQPLRDSTSTNDINSGVILENYPKDIWLGYMLLSRTNGEYIGQYEVENALGILASAVFDLGYTLYFDFPLSSTQTPSFSPRTTPRYTRYALVGTKVYMCDNIRFLTDSTTICEGNMTPSLLEITAEVPTPLGFSVPMQAAISGCVDNDACWNGCSNFSNNVGNISILSCDAFCCSYSYCNYHYYYYHHAGATPPNITIPKPNLPNLPVEILPNCYFKQIFSRLTTCVSEIFNAWPFSSTGECRSSILTGIQCGADIFRSCNGSDLFSTALIRIPPDFDVLADSIHRYGVLEILCEIPDSNSTFANFTFPGSINSAFSIPVFPSPAGVGAPYCDNFILDSLISWSLEYFTVLKTTTDRNHMCSYLNGLVNNILDAVESRCDFEHLVAAFPCDSLTRNQLRALVAQAQELLPQITPSYCDGIEPPTEPERPDDIPLLPSCTLRQTIKSVWTCEKIFTSSAPYSDSDVCKTNINRFLQCVANQLQACEKEDGYNVFDNLLPGITFQNIIDTIRSSTRPPSQRGSYYNSYYHSGRNDFLERFCSGSSIHISNFDEFFEAVLGVCGRNLTGKLSDHINQAYNAYAGARNTIDVCMAFRGLRDWFYNAVKDDCDFSLFQYFVPVQSPTRNLVSHGIDILFDVLPELEVSICPKVPTNQTSGGNWLKSYIKWRLHSVPRWQSAFAKWSSDTGFDAMEQIPSCLDLTNIMCRNPEMKTCESDYYKCPICSCSDNNYKNLTGIVMEPWIQDYENWEKFMALWEDKFDEWENELN